MSKRLQVMLDETEFGEIREIARHHGVTVSEWVRQTLRRARREQPTTDVERKLAVIRAAVRHRFPAGDIDEMLEEVERGYLQG